MLKLLRSIKLTPSLRSTGQMAQYKFRGNREGRLCVGVIIGRGWVGIGMFGGRSEFGGWIPEVGTEFVYCPLSLWSARWRIAFMISMCSGLWGGDLNNSLFETTYRSEKVLKWKSPRSLILLVTYLLKLRPQIEYYFD